MKLTKSILLYLTLSIFLAPCEMASQKLENSITAAYLSENISDTSPKLILTPAKEEQIRMKLKSDPYVQAYYANLQREASDLMKQPLVKRELQGFRLLFVSREMLRRMSVLSMLYRLDQKPEILARIDEELKAVCAFQDWNPQHFLDIAEVAFGVSLAIDFSLV